MECHEYIKKKLLLAALIISLGFFALGLFVLTSCSLIMNQTEGSATDSIDEKQDATPTLNATLPMVSFLDDDQEPLDPITEG